MNAFAVFTSTLAHVVDTAMSQLRKVRKMLPGVETKKETKDAATSTTPAFPLASLSPCVMNVVSNFLSICELENLGVSNKGFKDLAVHWLKKRALCCYNHVENPKNWCFFFYRFHHPAVQPDPFWASCFQCRRCQDIHFKPIEGGHEGVDRRSVLLQFPPNQQPTTPENPTGELHPQLMKYMGRVEVLPARAGLLYQ